MKIIKNCFILCLVIFQASLFAQTSISGIVIASKTKEALPYVNIGIPGKDIGTVSNTKGEFHLQLEDKYLTDSLKISIIGFKSSILPISYFSSNTSVFLEEDIVALEEIVLSNKNYKTSILGNKKPKSFLALVSFSTIEAGNELGIKVNIGKKPAIVEKFNLIFIKNEYGNLKLRINFYDLKNGIPNNRINNKNIIVETAIKEGILTVDLTEYDLVMNTDFFVSIESLNRLNDGDKKIVLAGRVLHKSYARKTSQSNWSKIKTGFCIFLDVKQ